MRNIPICVSKKILADVSSGIYRTPANALKELVSNAFDASAHRVFISTNYPYFDVFTCEDDGKGISAKEFENIIKIIGSSEKRAEGNVTEEGRPIIGKIGIGLLAVAQICNKFTVISKKKGEDTYFEAVIDIKQFDKVEKEKNYWKGTGEISLGNCQIEDNLKDEVGSQRHYTKIIMEEIKEGFKLNLLKGENIEIFSKNEKLFKFAKKAEKSEDFIKFINSIKNKKFNELSQYSQLIWELGLLCPVEYVKNGPLPDNNIINYEVMKLKKNDFKVFIDGFEIFKPILFPTEKLTKENIDYKIYPHISFKEKVDNSELSFSGYIFHQRKKIQPEKLQGLLIRIKGVAIGNYDRTFLHYPKAEGPMFSQISGEIFVENGLEEALNIDRNSFNETHSHFLELQKFLWNYLGGKEGVFKDIRKRSNERQESVHIEKSELNISKAIETVRSVFNIEIKLERKRNYSAEPYKYNKKENKLILYSNPFWAKNYRERMVQERMVMYITVARSISNSIDSFEKNIVKLFTYGK